MDARKLTDKYSVSPQITVEDLPQIAEAGFTTVICNRPDGEGADQPSFEEIEAAAGKLGMEARYLPIVAGKVGDTDAEEFGRLMESLPKPILAYCRTGTRSATLWSLSQAEKLPLSDILSKTKAAGYDMGGVARRLPADDILEPQGRPGEEEEREADRAALETAPAASEEDVMRAYQAELESGRDDRF